MLLVFVFFLVILEIPSCLLSFEKKNSPFARIVSAANHLCEDVDVFRAPIASLRQILG